MLVSEGMGEVKEKGPSQRAWWLLKPALSSPSTAWIVKGGSLQGSVDSRSVEANEA